MSIKVTKARNFTFIIYPESIPENFIECLTKLGISMAVSPLHDMDKKPDQEFSEDEKLKSVKGEVIYKKPHYHVLYIARNPVTIESVRGKIKRVLGNKSLSHIEIADDVKNVFLYLTHESKSAIEKKKHKYDKEDIQYINDFDIDRYITLDENQKRELKNLLLNIIRKEHLVNVIHLLDFIESNGSQYGVDSISDVNDVVTANAGGFRLYFDANYQDGYRRDRMYDKETGEIKNGK